MLSALTATPYVTFGSVPVPDRLAVPPSSACQPPRRVRRPAAWTALLAMAALLLAAAPARALDNVTLQLKHLHQFQFAGYYAALEQGYYRDAGLNVKILEGSDGNEPERAVLAGAAEYGTGSCSLLLSRAAGKPVVVLAAIFQHSPYALAMRQSGAAPDIRRIIGQRVMIGQLSDDVSQSDELIAYLRRVGIPETRLRRMGHSYNPDDLINGYVDAVSVYVTNEPDYLDRVGFAYDIYSPRAAGIDFYGDNLFTSERELASHPERVRAFRAASLRGWQYAMSHQEETVDLILNKYSRRHDRQHLLFEARQMVPLVQPVLVEIGYMNPQRWREIADVYASLGLLRRARASPASSTTPTPAPAARCGWRAARPAWRCCCCWARPATSRCWRANGAARAPRYATASCVSAPSSRPRRWASR